MIRLADARRSKGAEVIYYPPHLTAAERVPERGKRGIIQDVGTWYVFVLYLGDRSAKATRPDDLVYAHPAMQESYEHIVATEGERQ